MFLSWDSHLSSFWHSKQLEDFLGFNNITVFGTATLILSGITGALQYKTIKHIFNNYKGMRKIDLLEKLIEVKNE